MKHYEAGGFKVGDYVRVVNYVRKGWVNNGGVVSEVDFSPERIGTTDFIEQITGTQGEIRVALSKSAWYNLDQLEKIDNAEKMKWFESTNAEGYLDM